MPTGLRRYQTRGHDHLITFSCYHRLPYLADNNAKSTFEHILEETRAKYSFEIHAYVVMPEHVHLLVSEPDVTRLATAINVLKFRTSKQLKGDGKQFWQTRYHDANILTHRRWLNALRYIHRNPVTRGLALDPEDWPWSSYRQWQTGEPGRVQIVTQRAPATTPHLSDWSVSTPLWLAPPGHKTVRACPIRAQLHRARVGDRERPPHTLSHP